MSVTVADSGPAPGKISFVPGVGSTVAAEAVQVGEGEGSDFAALMREATGAPVGDSERLKPGKVASSPEGKKAKKDKIKGEGELPVQVLQPEATKVATAPVTTASVTTAPIIVPASAYTPPPPVEGGMTGTDEDATPAILTGAASTPRAAGQGEAPTSRATEVAEVSAEKAAPVKSPAPAETTADVPQGPPTMGKRRSEASPEATSEPKTRAAKPEAVGTVPTTKASAAPQPSDEIGRSVPKAAPQEVSPSHSQAASPPGEPTRTRAGRQRVAEGAVASPIGGGSDAASQPVRAGEATALLAVARRADKRAPLVVDEGAVVPRGSGEKPGFPAKGTGATHASAVALAAVQAGPVSATRASGPQPKTAGEQADGPSEVRETPSVDRSDTPAASAAPAAAALPLPVTTAAAGAVPMGGIALSGALGQQVVDLGVSGRWIDDIAREIASVAANPGQGSFQIASPSLGAVRVDIAPGKDGSDVLMTVDSDAARAALSTETDRLMQDARLASVRLGEVRVERAGTPADSTRSDGSQQQSGGQGTPTHGQTAMGQGNGQGGQHSAARPDAAALMNQNNDGNSPKAPFIKSVLQDSGTLEQSAPDRGRGHDRARYA